MAAFGTLSDTKYIEMSPLPSTNWIGYVTYFSGMVDEAKRVIKAGGLQDPMIQKHLRESRSNANQKNFGD